MLKVDLDNSIRLTRGDTAYLTVEIKDELTGDEYRLGAGERLTLTVRQPTAPFAICIQQVRQASNRFKILPEETTRLAYGSYRYDVELMRENGDIHTVIEPASFRICEEVTYT